MTGILFTFFVESVNYVKGAWLLHAENTNIVWRKYSVTEKMESLKLL